MEIFWDLSQPSATTANARACEVYEPHMPVRRKREDLACERRETRTPGGPFCSNIDCVARVRIINDCFAVKGKYFSAFDLNIQLIRLL